ncbi:hypothetical protein WA026_010936 [Henosepilachna vigintioctopunctata]|uniref:Uncharacterized protein n=1 Tax=Henosepilachna vigintioctopunctata TaxID=420089 RepID=A0AAW1UZP5_9CUCU
MLCICVFGAYMAIEKAIESVAVTQSNWICIEWTGPYRKAGRGGRNFKESGLSYSSTTRGINLDANAICLGLTCTPCSTPVPPLFLKLRSTSLNNAANFKVLSLSNRSKMRSWFQLCLPE